jgi:hypothetical protein
LVTGALAADGEGGFYVLANKDGAAVHHFDSGGRLTHSLGRLGVDNTSAKGWIGVGPAGSVYFRASRALDIQRFAKGGSPLSAIKPAVPYDAVGDPGDSIFTTKVLTDGRIVMEIAHRTPYRAVSGGLATSIQLKTYILSSTGKLLKTIGAKGLGQLGGVSRDRLYFVTVARGLLSAGEGARVHQLAIN